MLTLVLYLVLLCDAKAQQDCRKQQNTPLSFAPVILGCNVTVMVSSAFLQWQIVNQNDVNRCRLNYQITDSTGHVAVISGQSVAAGRVRFTIPAHTKVDLSWPSLSVSVLCVPVTCNCVNSIQLIDQVCIQPSTSDAIAGSQRVLLHNQITL